MRRSKGEPCPIPPHPVVGMDVCSPCVYFRGAASITGSPLSITCNWPRNGSEVWQDPGPAVTMSPADLARLMDA